MSSYGSDYPTEGCLRICSVAHSTWYEYQKSEKMKKEKEETQKAKDQKVREQMRTLLRKFNGVTPGARTFRVFLWREYEVHVSRKRVSRLMKQMNLRATMPKRDAYKGQAKHDHPCTAPENPVDQNFNVGPRKIICTDITYVILKHIGITLYLCSFRDAYTKEILGYACGKKMDTGLIREAYEMMMRDHGKSLTGKENVYVQSDQGTQYLSTTFKKLLEDDNLIQSVSARGNSQDNAPAESFFATFKREIMEQIELCTGYEQAIQMISEYINHYNNERYQYNLAGLSPREFYLYRETGIYPCDTYFGIPATQLRPLEELVEDKLWKIQKLRESRKKDRYARRRRCYKLSKDPLEVNMADQRLLEYWIRKAEEKRDEFAREAERLKGILEKAVEAQKYMESMSVEERLERYSKPQSWQNSPELNYIYEMDGLFN